MLSLLRLERKQKNSSNPFRIRIFFFLSYSFGIETIKTFIQSRSPLKNHTRFRPKWSKCVPVFRPKPRKNPTRWGSTYLYSLYKGVPPPPSGVNSYKEKLNEKNHARRVALKYSCTGLKIKLKISPSSP